MALGGHGDLYLAHKDYPYQDRVHSWGLQPFILGQLGFSLQSLIRLYVYGKKSRDIIEMTLHEIITLYLFGGCYLIN